MEEECDSSFPPRCVSYLQARDPSIVSWNRPRIENVRQNLANVFSSESIITIPPVPAEKQDEGLSVYLRLKGGVPPNDLYTIENNILVCAVPEGSQAARNNREKTVSKKYKFTNIFSPDTSQATLFNTIIKDKILGFINGTSGTLLAYGVSGSGKTFTMMGTAENPGVIPRSLDYLFRTISIKGNQEPYLKPLPNGKIELLSCLKISQEIENLSKILQYPQAFSERTRHVETYNEMQRRLSSNKVGILNTFPPIVAVWVSFAEIYNENIYDLLEPLPGRGQLRPKLKIGGSQDDTYIRGLKYICVRSGLEAYQVLQYGLHNLSYAATAVNQHSSRSHCIFSVRLIAGNDERNCSVSVFNFCDLAGSERLKKTMNEGDRLKESTKINTSLSVLGRCISNIRDLQQNAKDCCNAPFRESKLTQLFQKALQGKEDILMIVTINPSLEMFDDTQHALIFSAIAKQIVTQKIPMKILKPNRFSSGHQNLSLNLDEEDEREEELRELRNERARLTLELSEQRQQYEMDIEAERTHLRTNYDKIIEVKDSQLSDLRLQVKTLKLTKSYLEKENRLLKRELYLKEQEAIIVLSSDEESEAEDEAPNSVTQNEIENLKKQVQHMERIQKENEELLKINRELSAKNHELEKMLEVAHETLGTVTIQHIDEVEELTSQNLMLEDQVAYQNRELEYLRERAVSQSEEIDRLEDQNQALLSQVKKEIGSDSSS